MTTFDPRKLHFFTTPNAAERSRWLKNRVEQIPNIEDDETWESELKEHLAAYEAAKESKSND